MNGKNGRIRGHFQEIENELKKSEIGNKFVRGIGLYVNTKGVPYDEVLHQK